MDQEALLKLAQSGELTEDAILQITQETRRSMLVNEIAQGIPEGKNMYRVMKLLEDMDSTALNMKKLDDDSNSADADRKAGILIAVMNKQLGGTNPFERKVGGEKDITPDPTEIPVIVPKSEEDAIGVSNLTYDEFVKEKPES
tara:strand:- start:933 stop:1361 length:429 start_codon:yes stop_codon:yes gene_type:complete